MKCNAKDMNIATNKYGLIHGGITKRLLSSDNAFKQFNISIVTKTVNDSVDAFVRSKLLSFSNILQSTPLVNIMRMELGAVIGKPKTSIWR